MHKQIKKYLENKRLTSFQRDVLLIVSKIPKGQVRSYKWVAKKIGHPSAFRAVGQVLRRNPSPFIIPCHRVVKNDYRLGGFIFGKNAKMELLSNEGLTIKKGVVIINKKEGVKDVRSNTRRPKQT